MANWLFFQKVIHHEFCDILGPLNRILSAAMNAFRPPLIKTDESYAELGCSVALIKLCRCCSRVSLTVISTNAVNEFCHISDVAAKSCTRELTSTEGDYTRGYTIKHLASR